MKKLFIIGAIIIFSALLYYAVSPLFRNIELNEEAPEEITRTSQENEDARTLMPSGFEDLAPEKQEELRKLMEEANKTPREGMKEEVPAQDLGDSAVEEEPSYSLVMGTVGHPADGRVRIIDTSSGPVIRYEDFSTINGPRLHVYLAKDLEAEEFVDLGPIKGTRGNINYSVPEGIDISEYSYVMYWCVPFGVLFNYAEI